MRLGQRYVKYADMFCTGNRYLYALSPQDKNKRTGSAKGAMHDIATYGALFVCMLFAENK